MFGVIAAGAAIFIAAFVFPATNLIRASVTEEATISNNAGGSCVVDTKDATFSTKTIANCNLPVGTKVTVSYQQGLPDARIVSSSNISQNTPNTPETTNPSVKGSSLQLVQTIALPNVNGRIDHMIADAKNLKLFVAALGNNSVEVVDLRSGKAIHSIAGLHEPQGIIFIPELNRILVANGGDGTVDIFDSSSFNLIDNIKFSGDADNMRYDAGAELVYVAYGDGAVGIINATNRQIVNQIMLPGHPESFQLEKSGSRIFVNIPTDNSIVIIDRMKQNTVTKWSLTAASGNFPMDLDESNHRLFVGSREPAKLIVFDTETGKEVYSIDIPKDPDDIFYDATNKRIYVSCGEGFVSVIAQRDADHYDVIEKIPTASGARTSLLVPELNHFYLAVPQYGNQEVEIRVYQVQP